MKTTLKLLATALTLSLGLAAATANATLISRLSGHAVYDTDLNITWLANANANGSMGWFDATAWASGLTVDGFSGWRLPTTLQPDASCSNLDGGSIGFNCTGSEMGHLFYNELGGAAFSLILAMHNANLALFQNVQPNLYWSGTDQYSGADAPWNFNFNSGNQGFSDASDSLFALAVRPGDVGAAPGGGTTVPEPATLALMGLGFVGLGWTRRRKA